MTQSIVVHNPPISRRDIDLVEIGQRTLPKATRASCLFSIFSTFAIPCLSNVGHLRIKREGVCGAPVCGEVMYVSMDRQSGNE